MLTLLYVIVVYLERLFYLPASLSNEKHDVTRL